MASTAATSHLLLLLLSAATLIAAVLAGASATAATTNITTGISCTAGHGLPDPQYPLPGCGWYVASFSCSRFMALDPPGSFRDFCCQQLEAIPAACWCTALRLMVANPLDFGPGGRVTHECRLAQARSARSLVTTKAQCGLPAVHGWPTCSSAPGEE